MNTAEIRLLEKSLEDKIAINKFNEDLIFWCCKCDSGIDNDKKPIHYNKEQKKKIDKLYQKTHGYCLSCLRIVYHNDFNMEYI